MSIRQLLLTVAAVSLLVVPACGGSSSGYLKVDSPLVPFEPPEEDELLEDAGDDDADAPADAGEEPDTPDAAEDDDA